MPMRFWCVNRKMGLDTVTDTISQGKSQTLPLGSVNELEQLITRCSSSQRQSFFLLHSHLKDGKDHKLFYTALPIRFGDPAYQEKILNDFGSYYCAKSSRGLLSKHYDKVRAYQSEPTVATIGTLKLEDPMWGGSATALLRTLYEQSEAEELANAHSLAQQWHALAVEFDLTHNEQLDAATEEQVVETATLLSIRNPLLYTAKQTSGRCRLGLWSDNVFCEVPNTLYNFTLNLDLLFYGEYCYFFNLRSIQAFFNLERMHRSYAARIGRQILSSGIISPVDHPVFTELCKDGDVVKKLVDFDSKRLKAFKQDAGKQAQLCKDFALRRDGQGLLCCKEKQDALNIAKMLSGRAVRDALDGNPLEALGGTLKWQGR